MHGNPENAWESRNCMGIPKKNNGFWKKKKFWIFFGFFLIHGNTENLLIPNGNTEFPKFLYPENSGILNSRKIPIPELQYSRRQIIREWPLVELNVIKGCSPVENKLHISKKWRYHKMLKIFVALLI